MPASSSMDATERRLVAFAASLRWSDLPPAARRAAKVRVIDSLGVALGVRRAAPVAALARLAPRHPTR